MTLEEELEKLKMQRDLLEVAADILDKVFMFFEKNSADMVNDYDNCCLEQIADEIREDKYAIEAEIADINEELGIDEDDDDSGDL